MLQRARVEAPAILDIRPMTPTIGAEIAGLDLREALDDAAIAALRRALLDWKVVFFRGQAITTEQHLAFGRAFGALEIHPFSPHKPGYPEVLAITHDRDSPGRENTWHSDVTWRLAPSLGSILRAVEVPPVGGDTLFADMYAAYDGLDDETKAEIDGRTAIHDFEPFRRRLRKQGASEAEIAAFDRQYPPADHPVVRTHPETGRKALYVSSEHTIRFKGMSEEESRPLVDFLQAHCTRPEFTARIRWEKGTVGIWDNRCCQHLAINDYHGQRRVMWRLPVGAEAVV